MLAEGVVDIGNELDEDVIFTGIPVEVDVDVICIGTPDEVGVELIEGIAVEVLEINTGTPSVLIVEVADTPVMH